MAELLMFNTQKNGKELSAAAVFTKCPYPWILPDQSSWH
jgi:hypothetical protein